MKTVQANDLELFFGDRAILSGVQLTLTTESKAALTGGNGSGKSTLMKLLTGSIKADGGSVSVQKGTRVSYLPQSGRSYGTKSLYDEAESAFSRLHLMAREKSDVEHQLSSTEKNDRRIQLLLERQHELEEELLRADYYHREKEIEQVLTGLGFQSGDFQRPAESFSGGWQMRIALAKVLLEHPDILLLDEPTNYLDLEARNWLEDFLGDYSGGFMIVSHDRYFLDTTVNETYELFMGGLKRYPGNYSDYLRRRNAELEELSREYEKQQEEIDRLNGFIQKFRYNASKAKQVQSRIKLLEKMERIEIPSHMKSIHFSFPPAPHSGKIVLEVEGLSKSYDRIDVLQNLSFTLQRGEKLVVTGPNGAGKSTLLRILSGQDQNYRGQVRYGAGVDLGYFSQEQSELERSESSLIELFESEAPTELVPRLRNLLGAFLFQGDDIYKALNVLSGGELSRVALLRMLMQPHNLLILDEPTNHLDIHSKDVLLDALKSFDGTLIFVSHDRYFIEQLAGRVLKLGGGEARDFPGDYAYYLYRLARERTDEREGSSSTRGTPDAVEQESTSSKDDYQQSRQQKNRLRKLETEESDLMRSLEENEEQQREIQERMADPKVYSDGESIKKLQHELEESEREHQRLSRRWEELLLEKEALESRV
ncbi:MAG TPA: ABC transporter ATP-binding protein [Sediminispirochaeta sp.]|nr:ABC transporter ATP-binding protein [Sediminispirochaeta sp.]